MIHYGAASPKLPRIKTSIVLLSPDRMSLRQHAWYRVASMWLPGLLDSGHFRPRTVIPLTISHKYFWSNQMLPLQPLILTICFGFWGIKSTLGPPHLRKSANPLTFGEVTHFRPYSEITPSVFNLTGHWYPSIHSTKGPWYPSIHFTKTRFLAAFQELARLQGVGTTEWVKYRMGEHSEHFVKSFAGNASLCCKLVGV